MMKDASKAPIVVGVGAVVFKGDEILVIKRGRPPLLGQWSIPGGKLQSGERLEDAVRREVREETGLKIEIIGLIDIFEVLPGENADDPDRHMLLVDYAARWASGEPVADDDAAAAEFVAIDEAKRRLAWDKTRKALEMALRLRETAQNPL